MQGQQRYTETTLLYESEQTQVHRAVRDDGTRVILKKLKHAPINSERDRNLRREFQRISTLPNTCSPEALALEYLDETPVIIMADSNGYDLTCHNSFGRFSVKDFLSVAIQTVTALSEVHGAGLVHKDINPSNILFLPQSGTTLLIDFGISAPFNFESSQHFNHHNTLSGTLFYLAPEQTGRMNCAVDNRADFYALGITFFEILTGQRPISGEDSLELVHAHIAKPPAALKPFRPDIPSAIAAILTKLMAKNTDDRYQSCLGLLADLQTCRDHFSKSEKIPRFPLGQEDISTVFRIPHKRYGQEETRQKLLAAYDLASKGQKQVVAVSGLSGSGKTTLVHELFRPVARSKGLFCDGKFDQFQNDQPHQAFIEAFHQICQWILAEDETKLKFWRDELLHALGGVGGVLGQALPGLELITGPLPKPAILHGEEARHRFAYAVRKFLGCISNQLKPLVLFIDDCQWMDLGSRTLFTLLADETLCPHVMLVGAFRDMENAEKTAFQGVYSGLKNSPVFSEIHIDALTRKDIGTLVNDCLPNTEGTLSLAKEIYAKSGGNPFFATQLLLSASGDGLIFFHGPTGKWRWNIEKIHGLPVADNVVHFMEHRLSQLPGKTRGLLGVASCLGHHFTQPLLAAIADLSQDECEKRLYPALAERILILSNNDHLDFAHDRIQEALHSSLSDQLKRTTHHKAGQYLSSALNEQSSPAQVFNAAYHQNQSEKPMHGQALEALLSLNIRAAKTAMETSAFNKAHDFYTQALSLGKALNPSGLWERDYASTITLFSQAAEAANLSGNGDQCLKLCNQVLDHARDFHDLFEIQLVRLRQHHASAQTHTAIEIVTEALGDYGVYFPLKPTEQDVATAVSGILEELGNVNFQTLAKKAETTDLDALSVMGLIAEASDAVYLAAPLLLPLMVVEQVRLSLTKGLCPESSVAFALMGLISCAMGQYKMGHALGELSLKVLDRFSADQHRCKTLLVAHNCALHWKRDIRLSIPPLREAYHWGLKSGDQAFAASAIHCAWYNELFTGYPLADLEHSFDKTMASIRALNQQSQQHFLRCYGQHMVNLRENVAEPWRLSGKIMDEEKVLSELKAWDNQTGLFVFYLNRAILGFLFDHNDEALHDILEAEKYLHSVGGLYIVPFLFQFKALISLDQYPTAGTQQANQHLNDARSCLEALIPMAESAPMNHGHRVTLVQAELAHRTSDAANARVLFDKAIQQAQANGALNDLILIYLQAGKFYSTTHNPKLAGLYLGEAIMHSQSWGAHGLGQHLATRFKGSLPGPSAGKSWHWDRTASLSISETTTRALDVGSIFKSVKVLSTEMDSDRLLEKTMAVLMENIGAERIIFMETDADPGSDGLLVRTHCSGATPTALEKPLSLTEYANLPMGLIRNAARNQKPLIVENPHQDRVYGKDPYIRKYKPLSVMAYPALRKGKLSAVVYLEHTKMTGIFESTRLEVLDIFVGHALVSLENARLYEQLMEYSHTLEDRVAARTAALEKANEKLERLTQVDGLTGISNRRHFDHVLKTEWQRMKRKEQPLSLIMMDIDFFKLYNDTYGHQIGDDCLRRVAHLFAVHAGRPSDLAARYGGEEFVMILPNTDQQGAKRVAEQIRKNVEQEAIAHTRSERYDYVTVSLGVATLSPTRDGVTPPQGLLESADKALYEAKRKGRNRVCVKSAD
ncbi:MAG: diguanylate cyclase [Desulfobacterium sp.]|nr:diguanylate cyclase [Desulfobacterium sp.]